MTAETPDDGDKVVNPRGRSKAKAAPKPKPNGNGQDSAPGWRGRLICSEKGKPLDCVANAAMVLRGDPAFAGKLHFNRMRQRTVVGSVPWHATDRPRDWIDRDGIALAEWCQLRGVLVKASTCDQAVHTVAHEREMHPLRDMLAALPWDGRERLGTWLTDYLGVPSSDYSEAVGRKWMISAAARAFQPGCKADHALILEGRQGAGKSTACSILALQAEWFTDEIADLGSKDSAQDLPGKWIIELGELSAMGKSAVERIKGFIARSSDHYRPSYGRNSQDFPRSCVFIGSTNSAEYLPDTTGNRRWWPVAVGAIDLDALRRDVGQLWGEAVAAYRAGEEWWLDVAGEARAAEEQEQRAEVDPWEELVLNAATAIHEQLQVTSYDHQGIPHIAVPKARVATVNAILDVMNVPVERRGKSQQIRVGIALRKAGWTAKEERNAQPPMPRRWYLPPAGG